MSDDEYVQDIIGLESFSLTESDSGAYVWFESVSYEDFTRVREAGAIANDDLASEGTLPSVEKLSSFLE